MNLFESAVLVKQKKPLKIFKLKKPIPGKNQVLVKIIYSGFCSSQYGEIQGLKGKDKYIPHSLGHEACGRVLKTGTGVNKVKKNDFVVLHWMKSKGKDSQKIEYKDKNGFKINSGKITTFSYLSLVSENRITKISSTDRKNLKILPLMGCSIPVAFSTLEKILKINQNKNILILGSGALGLPMIHYCKHKKLRNIDVLERNTNAIKKSKKFGATNIFKNLSDFNLKKKLQDNFYNYIVDTTGSSMIISKVLSFPVVCKFAFLGVPHFREKIKFNSLKINYGLKLLGSYGGNYNPDRDLIRYLRLLKKTKFKFNIYIDKIYNLKKINKLISDFKNKKIIGKALIKF